MGGHINSFHLLEQFSTTFTSRWCSLSSGPLKKPLIQKFVFDHFMDIMNAEDYPIQGSGWVLGGL